MYAHSGPNSSVSIMSHQSPHLTEQRSSNKDLLLGSSSIIFKVTYPEDESSRFSDSAPESESSFTSRPTTGSSCKLGEDLSMPESAVDVDDVVEEVALLSKLSSIRCRGPGSASTPMTLHEKQTHRIQYLLDTQAIFIQTEPNHNSMYEKMCQILTKKKPSQKLF